MEHSTCNRRNETPSPSKFLQLKEFWNARLAYSWVEFLHKTQTESEGEGKLERREVEAVKTLLLLHIAIGLKPTSLICCASCGEMKRICTLAGKMLPPNCQWVKHFIYRHPEGNLAPCSIIRQGTGPGSCWPQNTVCSIRQECGTTFHVNTVGSSLFLSYAFFFLFNFRAF